MRYGRASCRHAIGANFEPSLPEQMVQKLAVKTNDLLSISCVPSKPKPAVAGVGAAFWAHPSGTTINLAPTSKPAGKRWMEETS